MRIWPLAGVAACLKAIQPGNPLVLWKLDRLGQWRLAFGIFAAFAEFEWELIPERTMAGLVATRAPGRMGGRPRKMDRSTLMMAMTAMADRKSIASDVAMRLGLTTTTLYVYVNGDGTPTALSR